MKTLLITGINGFTGRYFLDYARSRRIGLRVVGIDVVRKGMKKDKRIKFIKANLLDGERMEELVRSENPDYILHLAGVNSTRDCVELLRQNVSATISLLKAVVKNSKRCNPRILIVGSSAEYGAVPMSRQPISEKTRLRPVTPYGVSKTAQEIAARKYRDDYGLDIIMARPFNIIGPGQPDYLVCGSLVKQVRKICGGKRNSGRLALGNLHTKRDFVDIRDCVRAYWKLLRSGKQTSGEVFNIGSGKAHSVKDVVDTLLKECGGGIEITQEVSRVKKGDIPFQRADIRKIKRVTNWAPRIPLERSLKDMLET